MPRSGFVQLALSAALVCGCAAHSRAPQPVGSHAEEFGEPVPPARWRSMIDDYLNLCRTAPMCRYISNEHPCDCAHEVFPCKETDCDDGPGCAIRLSCTDLESGDDTAPPLHAGAICVNGRTLSNRALQRTALARRR